jgi:hypothetical protein
VTGWTVGVEVPNDEDGEAATAMALAAIDAAEELGDSGLWIFIAVNGGDA